MKRKNKKEYKEAIIEIIEINDIIITSDLGINNVGDVSVDSDSIFD